MPRRFAPALEPMSDSTTLTRPWMCILYTAGCGGCSQSGGASAYDRQQHRDGPCVGWPGLQSSPVVVFRVRHSEVSGHREQSTHHCDFRVRVPVKPGVRALLTDILEIAGGATYTHILKSVGGVSLNLCTTAILIV